VPPPRLQKSLFGVLSHVCGHAPGWRGGRGEPTGEYATGLKSASITLVEGVLSEMAWFRQLRITLSAQIEKERHDL
jgi:hypothetical protein